MTHPISIWTEERIAELTQRYEAGESAGKIGADMGFSRSAIAGKINRLWGKEKREARNAGLPKASPRPRVPREPRVLRGRQSTNQRKPTLETLVVIRPPVPLEPAPTGGVGWDDYNPSQHCHWPLSDPRDPNFRFCGAVKLPVGPYCPEHRAVAHRRPGDAY